MHTCKPEGFPPNLSKCSALFGAVTEVGFDFTQTSPASSLCLSGAFVDLFWVTSELKHTCGMRQASGSCIRCHLQRRTQNGNRIHSPGQGGQKRQVRCHWRPLARRRGMDSSNCVGGIPAHGNAEGPEVSSRIRDLPRKSWAAMETASSAGPRPLLRAAGRLPPPRSNLRGWEAGGRTGGWGADLP